MYPDQNYCLIQSVPLLGIKCIRLQTRVGLVRRVQGLRFIITLSSYELYSFHIFSMNLLNQKMFNLQYSPTPYRILRNHSEWFIRNDSFLPVWICNIVCLRFLLKSSSESELSALSDFEVTETICPSSRSISKSCVRVCFSKSWSHWCSYNVHGFLNHDIFSATHTLRFQY